MKAGMDDELRPEYDLSEVLKDGVRGKYAERYEEGTNLVLLAPDVAAVFPDEKAVNDALRLVIQLTQKLEPRKTRNEKRARKERSATCPVVPFVAFYPFASFVVLNQGRSIAEGSQVAAHNTSVGMIRAEPGLEDGQRPL